MGFWEEATAWWLLLGTQFFISFYAKHVCLCVCRARFPTHECILDITTTTTDETNERTRDCLGWFVCDGPIFSPPTTMGPTYLNEEKLPAATTIESTTMAAVAVSNNTHTTRCIRECLNKVLGRELELWLHHGTKKQRKRQFWSDFKGG